MNEDISFEEWNKKQQEQSKQMSAIASQLSGNSEKEMRASEMVKNRLKNSKYDPSDFQLVYLTSQIKILFPRKNLGKTVLDLKLSDLVDLSVERNLNLMAGGYVIIGGPTAGKTLLASSMQKNVVNKLSSDSVLKLDIMEPTTSEGSISAITDEEIEAAFDQIILSDEKLVIIDSLRFLNAASKYPARQKGISAGLEIYATILDAFFSRLGKIGIFIMSTGDDNHATSKTYANLMQGSLQGVFLPSKLSIEEVGSTLGRGEVSVRGGDRSYIDYSFKLDSEISLALNVKEFDTRIFNDHFLGSSIAEGVNNG